MGTSGNWKIRPRDLDKVIIYHELNGVGTPRADIYLADYVDSVQSPEQGRYIIQFQGYTHVGVTDRIWSKFASTSQNPVRYLKG